MKRVISFGMAVLMAAVCLAGCSGISTNGKTLMDKSRFKGFSLEENNVKEFTMAYTDGNDEYNTDKVFSFTEMDGITLKVARVKNGYFYVNTNISNENYANPADATVKFQANSGDKFYENWMANEKDKIEQIDELTFYKCDDSSSGLTSYYVYKLIKNDATKESKASTSEYAKYAKYVVAEIQMYIFNDYKTGRYAQYTEDDFKNEVIKIATCISKDTKAPFINDVGCVMSYKGITCKDYKIVKEVSPRYLSLRYGEKNKDGEMTYNELVSLRVESIKDENQAEKTAEAYLSELLTQDETYKEVEVFGLKAVASADIIIIPFEAGESVSISVNNIAASEGVEITNVITFLNENLSYDKKG